jgi:cytochrome d ubiquinol oxidase subunit II
MTYEFLQTYWWCIVSLLGALLVFLLFVQGGQSLLYTLAGRDGAKLPLLLRALGKKWELTFTTLVTFGGAFFASFPLFYSTSFGGAYWVWMLILFSFVVQAVSYEYINKKNNLLGSGTYRAFLFLNGVLGPVLLGAAVSTLFHGAEFTVNKENLAALMPVISVWQNSLHGLEAVGNLWNVALGLAVFFLARTLASLFFINNIADDDVCAGSRRQLLFNAAGFLLFFLPWLVKLFLMNGLTIDSDGAFSVEPHKYFNNLLALPAVAGALISGVALVLFGIGKTLLRPAFQRGIWFAGAGTVLVVFALLLLAGLNGTAYYPSLADPQSSLALANSSSSETTLRAMSVVSLFIPAVLAYIAYAWRSIDKA